MLSGFCFFISLTSIETPQLYPEASVPLMTVR